MASATDVELELDSYRRELTGYCYRMLGSAFEAQDAVQETMVRAWRSIDRFEGRSSLRSWLYRIATNVCMDQLRGRQRRARPMDLEPPSPGDANPGGPTADNLWLEPLPEGDPAEKAVSHEGIRLAFVAALQHLPARQRAVLILREVLRWQATEVAELLDTSVAAVNSALQRARATLAESDIGGLDSSAPQVDEEYQSLLKRYVDAFERFDMDALVSLLREDAFMEMPPWPLWLEGAEEIRTWNLGNGIGCKGSRYLPTWANGIPAIAQYRPNGPDGRHFPWGIHLLDVSDGRISGIHVFTNTELFPLFGLPATP